MGQVNPILSLVFGLAACALLGRYLERCLGLGRQCLPATAVVGLACVGLATFVLGWLLPPLGLQWSSLLVWTSAAGLGVWHWRREGAARLKVTPAAAALSVAGALLLAGVWTMVGYGDELDTWMTVVKEAVFYDDVPRQEQHTFSPWRDFFGLTSMMQVALTAPLGVFHPGVGRMVTLLMAAGAIGELGRRLRIQHGEGWGSLGPWLLTGLVVLPFCEIHASWYVDAPLGAALALCVAAAQDVVTEDSREGRRRLLFWFLVAVLMKPHAGLLALYIAPLFLIRSPGESPLSAGQLGRRVLLLVPGLTLWSIWRLWGHFLDDSGVGTWGLERLFLGEGVGLGVGEILLVMFKSAWEPLPNPPLLAHFGCIALGLVLLVVGRGTALRSWWLVIGAHYIVFVCLFFWVLRPDQVHYWARYSLHAHYLVAFLVVDGALSLGRHLHETRGGGQGGATLARRVVLGAVLVGLSASVWFLHNLPREQQGLIRSVAEGVRGETTADDHIGVWGPYAAMIRLGHELCGDRKASVLYSDPYRSALRSEIPAEQRLREWRELGVTHLLFCFPGRGGAQLLGEPQGQEACVLYRNAPEALLEVRREPTSGVDLSERGRLRAGFRSAFGWPAGAD